MRLVPRAPEIQARDVEERILAHLRLTRAVALRTVDPRCVGADREDLLAAGVLGLVQAARRYRVEQGASFGAYAARRVRGQVLDALRERDPLTCTARRAYRAARAVNQDLPPPYAEVSLEKMLESGREPQQPAPERSPRNPRWPALLEALRELPAPQRRVLALSYGRGLTLKEVGTVLGLSESGACRLRARALTQVRAGLRAGAASCESGADVQHPQSPVCAAGPPRAG